MAGRTQSAVLVALLALVVAGFFGDVLFGDRVLVTSNTYRWLPWAEYAGPEDLAGKTYRTDSARTYLPRRVYARESLASGDFPLWNPYILGGSPFFADPQTALLYPPGLPLLAAPPAKALGYDVALHVFLAALGMFLFLGAIDTSAAGRVLGALAYSLSSFFFLRQGHPTFVASAAWLPYLFFAYERSRRSARSGGLLLMLFLSLGYLAGMPQVFAFAVAALLFYAALDGLEALIRGDRSFVWRNFRVMCVAAGVALLVVCVQLVPFVEYVRNSEGLGFTLESMSRDHLWQPVFLLRTLVPDFFGNPVDGTSWIGLVKGPVHPYNSGFMVYCGMAGLGLALASLVFLRRSRHIRAFFGLLVLSIGAGTSVLLLRLIYAVFPPAAYSQIDRVSVLACFALAALAGKGISLARAPEGAALRRGFIAIPTGLAGALALGLLFLRLRGLDLLSGFAREAGGLTGEIWFRTGGFRLVEWLEQAGTTRWLQYEMRHVGYALLFACLSAACIWFYVGHRRRPRLGGAAVWVLAVGLILDLGFAARRYYVTQPADCLAETEGIRMLSQAIGKEAGWRMGASGALDQVFPVNTPQIFDIPAFGGLNAFYPTGYVGRLGLAGAISQAAGRSSPLVGAVGDLMCVRYLVCDRPQPDLTVSPVVAAMARSGDLTERLSIVGIGGDRRLSLLVHPGEACSLYTQVPQCRYLDFSLGLRSRAGAVLGPSLGAEIGLKGRGGESLILNTGPLAEAGETWTDFRLDVSELAGQSVAVVLRVPGDGRDPGPAVAWSGFDFVERDCDIAEIDGGYTVHTGGDRGVLALRLAGPAGEWPVGIAGADGGDSLVQNFVRFEEPRGATLLLAEAGGLDGEMQVLTAKHMRLLDARLIKTAADAPIGLSPFYDGDMFIYENHRAMPKGICVERSLFDGFDWDGEDAGTLNTGAVVTGLASHVCGRAVVRLQGAGEIAVHVDVEKAAVLLFQDTWYPGWRVAVDGVDTHPIRTDLGIRAVPVEEGEHEVTMEYRPWSLRLGLGLSLIGIVLGVFYGVKAKRD
jgi:hypothetical protein